jgi:hypothetical protein
MPPAHLHTPHATLLTRMVPPLASVGPSAPPHARFAWLTADRQLQIRNVLFGIVLFVGLAVWVFHTVAARRASAPDFVQRLRVVGVMTWVYALVQILDIRFWQSRFARRRREQVGLPEHMIAWLFGQMLPWFGIVYYALVRDLRPYVAGLVIAAITCWALPASSGVERPATGQRR